MRPKLDLGHVAQPDQGVAAVHDHETPEGGRIVERGLGVDVDLHEIALHLAGRRGEVIAGQRRPHIEWRDAERGHAVGIEPDAHGKHLPAKDLGIGHAVDGLQLRLHHSVEIVADLRAVHHLGVEGQVHERVALARLLGDDGIVGLAR